MKQSYEVHFYNKEFECSFICKKEEEPENLQQINNWYQNYQNVETTLKSLQWKIGSGSNLLIGRLDKRNAIRQNHVC